MDNYINLRDLFTKDYDNLPELVDSINCIYRITNLVNKKIYIGLARWLYGRFVANGEWSHLTSYRNHCQFGSNRILYKAIKKYGSKNFEVDILESNLDLNELGSKESYYIKLYRCCIYDDLNNGYNMTYGGDDCSHLHTPESLAKSYESNLRNHGGKLPWESPEVRARALETNRRNHGGVLAWNTPEALETNRRNHGGRLAWDTDEAREKRYESQALNHDGYLAFHTPEAREKAIANSMETKKLMYNGDCMGACHTDEALRENRATKLLINICGIIYNLTINGFELTPYNYLKHSGYSELRKIKNHIISCLDVLDLLRARSEWTSDMEALFQYFESNNDPCNNFNLSDQ